MKILWVKMGGLWPATTGGRTRSLQILSELARRHEVSVITTHGAGDDPDGLRHHLRHCQHVSSIPYAVPKRGTSAFPAAVAQSWFSKYPVDLWKWHVPEVRRQVESFMASGSIDICIADFLFAAANVPMQGRVPVVLFEHNVEYLIWNRLASLETRLWRRALLEMEWRKLRAREADACSRADLTIAVSEHDRRRLAEMAPDARIAAVSTGVDTRYFCPNGHHERTDHLVFSGSMDWHPNEDAVIYFTDAILPRIRAQVPAVSFTVIGRNPTERLRTFAARSGITLTGTLDDVRPSIAEGAVYVVPLRAGSGTRIKIFEALAMAKPVVSTTVGAEGLALESGRHFLPADEPDAFADAVLALLRDPERRRALGQAGRALVDAHYSWGHVAREFETRCGEILQHADAPRLADSRAHLSRRGSYRSRGARIMAGEHGQIGWSHPHS